MATADAGLWSQAFAQRTRTRGDAELAAILAGSPPGVLSMMGGFPNPETFPAGALEEIVGRLLRDDPGVALQYAPSEGIASQATFVDLSSTSKRRVPKKWQIELTDHVTWWTRKIRTRPPQTYPRTAPSSVKPCST